MARLSTLFLTFLLGAGSALALVSCGGGSEAELLPGTTAEQIESNLDQVAEQAGEGDCIGAEDAVAEVTSEVEELQGVDRRLKAALEEGTAKLSAVVDGCEEEAAAEETEPAPETTVEADAMEAEEKKPKKDKKAEKEEEAAEKEEETSEGEGPNLPPPSNGKGEENGQGGGEPPAESEAEETPSSGGVGPSVGVEE